MDVSKGSLLWNYFKKVEKELARCNICKKDYRNTEGNTSGMKKHLKIHKEAFEEYSLAQAEKDRLTNKTTKRKCEEMNVVKPNVPKQLKLDFTNEALAIKQKQLDDAIVRFVAETGTSFNALGQDSFKDVIKIANRNLKVKDPSTISKQVRKYSRNVSSDVCDIIAAVKTDLLSVGFTTDMWTSRPQDSYISLTASFIDKNWELHRWVPYIKHFPSRHTGSNISVGLDKMVRSLGLHQGKIKLYSVNDNASNMKVAIRESEYLTEYNCTIHTIQLAVNDTFNNVTGMKTVLDKSKAIAKYCHQSTPAMDQLRAKVKDAKLPWRKPKNPCETRWNSQLDNMISIKPYQDMITDLCLNVDEWDGRNMDPHHWALMEGAITVLEPIRKLTKALEGDREPTINKVIERLYTTDSIIDDFIANPENARKKKGVIFARELKKNLNKRFPNHGMDNRLRRAANFLDPRFKGIHLDSAGRLESTMDELEEDWNDIKPEEPMEAHTAVETPDNYAAQLSPTSKLRNRLQMRTNLVDQMRQTKIRKEMEKYSSFSTPPQGVNVLSWWKRHESILPILAKLAKLVLAIPASSALSERVYSVAGDVVTAKRSNLNPKKVEEIVIIKTNLKKVEEFKKNSDYVIVKTGNNAFVDLDLEVKVAANDESGAAVFDDDENGDNREKDQLDYDTDLSSSDEEDVLNVAMDNEINISF